MRVPFLYDIFGWVLFIKSSLRTATSPSLSPLEELWAEVELAEEVVAKT